MLSCVVVSDDVLTACTQHALSTEQEEVMGLLLGDILDTADGGKAAHIWGVSIQIRSDRRKDRVEVSPTQLSEAAVEADRIAESTGRPTRVVGWYHSHPRITVLPSHVDLRTQHGWQHMDPSFVGLIFSCFEWSREGRTGRVQTIAFQAVDTHDEAAMASLTLGERKRHRSQDGRFMRREVPVQFQRLEQLVDDPRQASMLLVASLANLKKLQSTLFREERNEYRRCCRPANKHNKNGGDDDDGGGGGDDGKDAMEEEEEEDEEGKEMHPLTAIHHACVYQNMLVKLLEYGCVPTLNMLRARHERQLREIEALKAADQDQAQDQ